MNSDWKRTRRQPPNFPRKSKKTTTATLAPSTNAPPLAPKSPRRSLQKSTTWPQTTSPPSASRTTNSTRTSAAAAARPAADEELAALDAALASDVKKTIAKLDVKKRRVEADITAARRAVHERGGVKSMLLEALKHANLASLARLRDASTRRARHGPRTRHMHTTHSSRFTSLSPSRPRSPARIASSRPRRLGVPRRAARDKTPSRGRHRCVPRLESRPSKHLGRPRRPRAITSSSSSALTVDSARARADERDGDARARLRAAIDATDDDRDDDATGGADGAGTPRRKNIRKCPNGWMGRRAADDARATVRSTRGVSVLDAHPRRWTRAGEKEATRGDEHDKREQGRGGDRRRG